MMERLTPEQAAALLQPTDVLGIPYAEYTQAGLFPVAYTIGTDFKPGPRADLADHLPWNAW